jgi:DHA1 family inner membrane transport protein
MQVSGIGTPTLALSVNIAAMNVGIAFGAWLGGWLLDLGNSLVVVLIAGALVTAAGFALSLVELARDRRRSEAPLSSVSAS